MLKSDMPLARFLPLRNTANFAPSGWKAAIPMPAMKTSTSEHAVARRDGGETEPGAGEREPGGQQPERTATVGPEPEERLHHRRRDRARRGSGRR